MSLKIVQGLFNLDFTDYHAILGVPVDADVKTIRKRYLAVARRLHPDSCATENEADRQRAAEFLSRLVNPAYEKLSQERNYADYCLLLRMKGQQALKQQDTVVLTCDPARRLAASGEIDSAYRAALRELAEQQYQHLNQSLDLTGQISELNLVYLMRKEGRGDVMPGPAKAPAAVRTAPAVRSPASPAAPPASQSTHEALLASYLRRAQEFETKQDYSRAILELRDAIKFAPQNSQCHSHLGRVYLKTNQAKMAKIHFEQALKLNPQDAVALEGKRKVEASNSGNGAAGKPDAKGNPQRNGQPDAKGGSGGLFGLFGSRKK